MLIFLYLLWFGFPTLFFLLALATKLDRVAGKERNENPKDFFSSGIFLLEGAICTVFIERLFLKNFVDATFGNLMPYGFFQFFLWPLVLLIGARLIGPSTKILIGEQKTTRPKLTRKK